MQGAWQPWYRMFSLSDAALSVYVHYVHRLIISMNWSGVKNIISDMIKIFIIEINVVVKVIDNCIYFNNWDLNSLVLALFSTGRLHSILIYFTRQEVLQITTTSSNVQSHSAPRPALVNNNRVRTDLEKCLNFNVVLKKCLILSCDQAALRTLLSVRLSVCLSVRLLFSTPFSLCSHHRIIMKFSGVITNDKSDVHAQGQRSKVKVTEVKTQLSCFRTVTPVWIHIWWWNDAQSLMLLRSGALLFFKVIRQISRSHG